MKQFTIHWIDGTITVVSGKDIEDAFTKAGYKEEDVGKIKRYTEDTE